MAPGNRRTRRPAPRQKARPRPRSRQRRNPRQKQGNTGLIILIVVIAVLLLAAIGIVIAVIFSHNKQKDTQTDDVSGTSAVDDLIEEFQIEPVDAEAYLSSIGNILDRTDVASAKTPLSAEEAESLLAERGFTDCTIEMHFTMDGVYTEEPSDKAQKHPIYEAYYATSDGNVWLISLINGYVLADPVFYNFQEDLKVAVLLSEHETMMSYDNVTNCYYEVAPDPSQLALKKVGEINAELLEKLSIEEIDKL